ncbi:MAG TPA: flagellar hook-basal body complex protein [Desulfotomaculum sp.]|nr:flagellar hook-basal body complex protein [Desulfotomaculum sp.]
MIRSLFAGVAGMKNHQIRMDVIANNISNVNTVGFKSGRANFQDTLYQTLKSAGTSTNPAQVGLGVSLAGISNNMNPGGLQSTGRTLDLAINGDGFFKVIDPGSGKEYYTRDGVFYIDQNGYVVNSSGYRLVGELRNITATRSNEQYSRVKVDDTPTPGNTTTLTLQGTRADGTQGKRTDFTIDTAQKANISAGSYTPPFNDSTPLIGTFGFAKGDVITVSYVDKYTNEKLSKDITIVDTSANPSDANSPSVSTVDDLKTAFKNLFGGNKVVMNTIDTNSDGNNDTINFETNDSGPGVSLSITCKTSTGSARDVFKGTGSAFTAGYATATGTGDDVDTIIRKINEQTSIVGVVASKDTQNRLILRTVSTNKDAMLEVGGDAAPLLGFPPDQIGVLKNPGNSATIPLQVLNGPPGTLNIDSEGIITGIDNNGFILEWEDGSATATNADFAQINLYTFANQDGLQRVNKNMFTTSEASGKERVGKPGEAGYGTIASGYLEMSNVDLTDEFTNMITTQRGYQASARIITVSDTMLDELINLKR